MPRLPISEQALRLALTRPAVSRPSQYVCRACVRQYHPSPALRAELPFWKRLTNSIFGSSEDKVAAEKRDEAHQKRLDELAEQGGGKTETFVDDQGREWTIAAIVDPSINKEYVQAQRWDGLEWVGSKEWIARRDDEGEQYTGFNPKTKLQLKNDKEWKRVLHHVTVEVLALAQAGRDIQAVCTERPVRMDEWKRTARVQIKEKGDSIELQLPTNDSLDEILKAIPRNLAEEIVRAAENAESAPMEKSVEEAAELTAEAVAADAAGESPEFYSELRQDVKIRSAARETAGKIGDGWLQIRLADPAIKLAILKRLQQLTGQRLRDPVISSATNLLHLYQGLKIKPEPKQLWKADELKRAKINLPNVTVHPGRQTPIHKHKQVGRWKVIEDELMSRGLPVTGSRYQGAKTTSPLS